MTPSRLRTLWLFAAASLLSACASPPKFNADKLKSVNTIAVIVPTVDYAAGTASVPMMIPAGGLLASTMSGAITGAINSAANAKTKLSFADVVKERVGDTKLSRRYVDAIEDVLRSEGYTVKEISANDSGWKQVNSPLGITVTGAPYPDADAVLTTYVSAIYQASGPLNSFHRMVISSVVIFDAKSVTPIFTKPLYFQKISDPDSYFTYSGLLADLPHAVNALDEAAMSLVPEFGEALKAADNTSRAIPTTAQASKSE